MYASSYTCIYIKMILHCLQYKRGAVVAQWIRPVTLSHEVPGFESAGSGSSALGQGTVSSLPSPLERTESFWSPGYLHISSLLNPSSQVK